MGYIYDTQVVYGDTKLSETNFRLNDIHYYKTKTGISKKQPQGSRAVKITNDEYDIAWNKYIAIFG